MRRIRKYQEKKLRFLRISFIIIATITFLFSIFIWFYIFRGTNWYVLIEYLQQMYVYALIFSLTFCSQEFPLMSTIIKIFFKLLFSVGLIVFIMISSLDQIDQSMYIIYITFFIVYLEVIIELNAVINQNIIHAFLNVYIFRKNKLENVKTKSISSLCTSFTIICISIIHILLPFFLNNFINDLNLKIISIQN